MARRRRPVRPDAGVQAIFGPGANLIHAAEVLRLLGHNMPPEDVVETAE